MCCCVVVLFLLLLFLFVCFVCPCFLNKGDSYRLFLRKFVFDVCMFCFIFVSRHNFVDFEEFYGMRWIIDVSF